MFTCEFCGKELSTNQNLKIHQKKTKYCLDKQKILNPQVEIIKDECQYCNKNFYNSYRKIAHESECIVKPVRIKYEQELNDQKQKYEFKISELTATINNIKMEYDVYKSTSNQVNSAVITSEKEKTKAEIYSNLYNNDQQFILEQSKRLVEKTGGNTFTNIRGKNITMNSLNLSKERLEALKDTYTLDHYDRGGEGQADWVDGYLLRDKNGNLMYKCTDKNRKNFIYQDENGNIINDLEARKLKEAIFPIIMLKLKEFKKIKFLELGDQDDDDNSKLDKVNALYAENRSLGAKFDKRLIEKTYGI